MDDRRLTDTYAVGPQIMPADVPDIAAAGYRLVICNRPDIEVPPPLQAAALREAVETAGMQFVDNPVTPGDFAPEMLAAQAAAIASTSGAVLAYCASGNRSAIVWGLLSAPSLGAEDVIARTAAAGYDHRALMPLFEAAARAGTDAP